ncbi:MAG: metallophosphoesterase [Azospirillum sp.]|nr:metallophosphoesterase [Azospirillum sp.]MCA3267435.1 metallophosphoesterase [Azospirillum sp.]MCZ8124937.1 metallophosphoesterase [Magnetospirillum sp.]
MTFRVAQISDTHLSPTKPHFVENFRRLAAHLRAVAPDLVVNTGDISLDGADSEADLRLARQMHDEIGLPWVAVPGNHDVGDDPATAKKQPLDTERVARFGRVFGAGRFSVDCPGWRLIGVNSLLSGADIDEARVQLAFLREAVAEAKDRKIALFLHKPLVLDEADADSYWLVARAGRDRIADAFGDVKPAVVACGHMHQFRRLSRDGTAHIWAPSCAFVVGDAHQARFGTKLVGYVEHDFRPDGTHEARLATVDGLALLDLGMMPEIYGQLPGALETRDAAQ